MKRFRFMVWFSVLLLASCNLPEAPTPDPNSVSTAVSLALTQTAIISGKVTLPPAATTSTKWIPTETVAKATQTAPIPTKTTPPSTQTPTLTPSLTPSLTPTLDSSDPRIKLGKATWEDKFHDGGYWGLTNTVYDDGSTRVEIKNDALKLTSLVGKGWHGWRVTYPVPKKYYLEATVHNINCGAGDYYGMLFQTTSSFEGYWLGVSCEGKYNLRGGAISNWKDIIEAKANPAILTGANKTNRLGVMVKGNQIAIYINGKLVDSVTDSSYPNPGTFGMFIVGWNPGFTYETEEMLYWELP